MMTAQAVGAASGTFVGLSPSPCESAASQYRVGLVYFFLNKAASSVAKGGGVECSSRVRRKSHARFLEGWARVTAPGYSAKEEIDHPQTPFSCPRMSPRSEERR